ncbi:MAG: encapsulin, partial [Gammaproteobacteria bacterium]|nr:encapsulin [Gammaproteobacteria bacterium]
MRYLNRESNPLPAQVWNEIDNAAVQAMREVLSARRFMDLEGPYGVGMTSLEVGADDFCREPADDEAAAVLSRAISVPMLRKNFKLSIRQVEAHLHMGQRFESSPIEDAAEAVARREEDFIYNGSPSFGVEGLLTARGRN